MNRRLPIHAYIPGGPFPRPLPSPAPGPIYEADWSTSPEYLHGFDLFNLGCYWEAHEVWEGLWHAHGRIGPIADLLKGLIKLAAAGVKVRQGQPRGVVTHATRAAEAIERARADRGPFLLGIDLDELIGTARLLAEGVPSAFGSLDDPLVRVFPFTLGPIRE